MNMKRKVMLVDDEPQVIDVMSHFLAFEDYEVLTACCAADALVTLTKVSVDIVISDDRMMGMSGSELLTIIRRDYPDTIRILLTGHADLEMAIRAINDGQIYRFFTKPCNFAELSITLRQALQQKDLIVESRRLLRAYKRQGDLLKQLEKQHPGMTKIDRTGTGSIVIDYSEKDIETLFHDLTLPKRKVTPEGSPA